MAKGKYEEWLTEEGLSALKAWARMGLTDEEIAQKCKINVKTLYLWKLKHDPICKALKETKDIADMAVVNALYKRAVGYSYEEVTTVERPNAEGYMTLVDRKAIIKHVAPDMVAQIFWLKNRQRIDWKNDHDKAQIDREKLELEKLMTAAQIEKLEADKDIVDSIEIVFDDKIVKEEWAD